jgi:hypothetical protein
MYGQRRRRVRARPAVLSDLWQETLPFGPAFEAHHAVVTANLIRRAEMNAKRHETIKYHRRRAKKINVINRQLFTQG